MKGNLLISEFIECKNKDALISETKLKNKLKRIVKDSGLAVLKATSYDFGKNSGITACVLLSESHVNIHTWPECKNSLVMDIFCCNFRQNNLSKMLSVFKELKKLFMPKKINKKLIEQNSFSDKTLKEYFSSKYGFFIKPEKKLEKTKSKFQDIELFQSKSFGRILRIDNYFQTSEKDEFFYHEPLVQIPMCCHNNPKRILIIGGGDGGALEEVLKHSTVKEVKLVELDKEVISFAKKHLKKINKNKFDDPKVKVIIKDGLKYVKDLKNENKNECTKNQKNKFDIVILDLTDPLEEAKELYTREFYDDVKNILNKNGILSLHTEYPLIWSNAFARIIHTLRSVFKNVSSSFSFVPLYGTIMSFAHCSDSVDCSKISKNKIKKRIKKRKIKDLNLYSDEMHGSLLSMPPYIKGLLEKKQRIITKQNQLEDIEQGFNHGKELSYE